MAIPLQFKIQQLKTVDENLAAQITHEMDSGTSWDIHQGELFLKNPDNVLFVAIVNELVIGYISGHRLQRFDKRKAEVLIYELAVNGNYRKRGIATALIKRLKEWAKEVGADEVWVLTSPNNIPAMQTYTSAGGIPDSEPVAMFTYTI